VKERVGMNKNKIGRLCCGGSGWVSCELDHWWWTRTQRIVLGLSEDGS